MIQTPVEGEHYLFFAAPYQPEAFSNLINDVYEDVFLILDLLCAHLPKDWKIYYKEHPATFDEMEDRMVGRISPDSILEGALKLCDKQKVDAIFVSCTNMKCAHIIPEIEQQTGLVAVSSNQALVWHLVQLAGLGDELGQSAKHKGRLFSY